MVSGLLIYALLCESARLLYPKWQLYILTKDFIFLVKSKNVLQFKLGGLSDK